MLFLPKWQYSSIYITQNKENYNAKYRLFAEISKILCFINTIALNMEQKMQSCSFWF
nr:MAG TPA: hypothetical protein [Caudoviricetes sp.]